MKYIKKFENHQDVINEKISLKALILALGLGYVLKYTWNQNVPMYKELKSMYGIVNSPKSNPNKKESQYIEEIKNKVIEKISGSTVFNKTDKKFILDSLKTIKFKVIDENSVSFIDNNFNAFYIHINPPDRFKKLFDIPKEGDDFIIVKRDILLNDNNRSTIVHEIYHYYDQLLHSGGLKSGSTYSKEIWIKGYMDQKIDDPKYLRKKINNIISRFKFERGSIEKEVLNSLIFKEFYANKDYYSSEEEIFARYNALKDNMVHHGFLNNVDQVPDMETIYEYAADRMANDDYTFMESDIIILLLLDLTKLVQLEKVI